MEVNQAAFKSTFNTELVYVLSLFMRGELKISVSSFRP